MDVKKLEKAREYFLNADKFENTESIDYFMKFTIEIFKYLLKRGEVNIMESGVIRSEEKNFEREKAKMFEPKTLNKEEQLRLVFTHLFASMITEYCRLSVAENKLIEKYTNIFIKEVKIRTKL